MARMLNAASTQGLEIGKEKLRDFLENSDTTRRAVGMRARSEHEDVGLDTLDSRGRRKNTPAEGEEDVDDI
jgi:hypothetical protein